MCFFVIVIKKYVPTILFHLLQKCTQTALDSINAWVNDRQLSLAPSKCKHLTIARNRGGVEDTRLEAKAKDTKKIQGQEQPFQGQTLSRPRTGMLEAKDQGHKRKCSPKKKRSSQKFFKRSPQKNVFQKIF